MIQNFKGIVKKYVEPGSSLVLAISGGSDSVCLLHLLVQLKDKIDLKLIVAHFNHHLRAESDQDEVLVGGLAKKYGLEFVVKSAETRIKSEDEARRLRYEWLESVVDEYNANWLVTAHHQDDQIETFWLHLLRGSGVRGLAGIPLVAKRKTYQLLRPLLGFGKLEILAYNKEHSLKFIEDKTNQQTIFLRNKIRLKLLPLLAKDYNPGIRKVTIGQVAYFQELDKYLKQLVKKEWSRALVRKSDKIVVLNRVYIQKLPYFLQTELVCRAISVLQGSCQDFYQSHIRQILDLKSGKLKISNFSFTVDQSNLIINFKDRS